MSMRRDAEAFEETNAEGSTQPIGVSCFGIGRLHHQKLARLSRPTRAQRELLKTRRGNLYQMALGETILTGRRCEVGERRQGYQWDWYNWTQLDITAQGLV